MKKEKKYINTKVTEVSIKVSIYDYNQKEHKRIFQDSMSISLRIYPFVFVAFVVVYSVYFVLCFFLFFCRAFYIFVSF